MKKPLNSLEDKKNDIQEETIQELWLLWKLGKKEEIQGLLLPLLQQHPTNPELLHLASLFYLDKKNGLKVRSYMDQLEDSQQDYYWTREIIISLALMEEKWRQAAIALKEELKKYPENKNLRQDYAFVLYQLRQWQEARKQYTILMQDPKLKKEIVWNYREVLQKAAPTISVKHQYHHSPESLRGHITVEKYSLMLNPSLRTHWAFTEETYTKRALGATASINENIYGHKISADWIANEKTTFSGSWRLSQYEGEDFHELGIILDHKNKNIHSNFGYEYNHLVRTPIEGLEKKGQKDNLSLANDILLSNRLTIGHLSEVQWYRVDPQHNQINNKENLGHKFINDGFMNVLLFNKPYISFNMHFKDSHWNKSFQGADGVLDFIGDERVYYGGFYTEQKVGSLAQISSSITRNFDEKRDLYATLSNIAVDLWFKDNIKTSMLYEYGHGVSGTSGSGNEQLFNFSLDYMF